MIRKNWDIHLVGFSFLVLIGLATGSLLAGPAPIEMVTEIALDDPKATNNFRAVFEWIRAHKDSATAHHDNCIMRADTLSPCLHDTLVIDFMEVFLRDTSDYVATGLWFFEMGPDSGSVRIVAADTMTWQYQLGLPDTIGKAGQLLVYDGDSANGFLYWRDSSAFGGVGGIVCDVTHDTISDCGSDIIFFNTQEMELRDEEDFASVVNAPRFKWYEDGTNDTQFVSLRAPAALDTSYDLTLPVDKGKDQDELLVDDTGGLWWYDRNVFTGTSPGTDNKVFLDTLRDDSTDGATIHIDTRAVHLINTASGVSNDAAMPRLVFHNLDGESTDLTVTMRLRGSHTAANNAEDWTFFLPRQAVNVAAGIYTMQFSRAGGEMYGEFVHVGGAGMNKTEYGKGTATLSTTATTINLEFDYISNSHIQVHVAWMNEAATVRGDPIWVDYSATLVAGVTGDQTDQDTFTVKFISRSEGNRNFTYIVSGTGYDIIGNEID